MVIIPINKEIRSKCPNCPNKFPVPTAYYEGMDLDTCPKVESCPCGMNPEEYVGCIYIGDSKNVRLPLLKNQPGFISFHIFQKPNILGNYFVLK
jgi:hypothetical protein